MSQNTVTFKVGGNEILSFFDKVKQKSDELTTEMIADAKQQTDVAKDQLKLIEDQIKAIERKNRLESEGLKRGINQRREGLEAKAKVDFRGDEEGYEARMGTIKSGSAAALRKIDEEAKQEALQTKLLRDNIETIKMTSNAEVIQMRKGDDAVIKELDDDSSPMDRLARELALQSHEDKNKPPKEEKEESKTKQESQFGSFIKAMAFEKGLGLVSQMPGAKNELDFVKPITAMLGMAIGGLLGNGIDAIAGAQILGTGAGKTNFGSLGVTLGEKAGEMMGTALERSYKGREELTSSNYRLQALTGSNMQIDAIGGANGLGGTGMSKVMADLSQYGSDFKSTSELQYKIATAKGTSATIGKDSENVMALQQALAVTQETSTGLMELQRSSRADARDVLKLVGGVLQTGSRTGGIFSGDRTFLNEFLGRNFATLQKQLLQTSEHVGSATTMDILQRFNSVGGMFSARDSRSGGLIGQIQNSLSNPTSDSMKAYANLALRRAHPGMSEADIDVEREKGLGSPEYLKAMLGTINQLGGSASFKRKNIAGMFGIGAEAAREIYENREKLMNGDISMGELSGTGALGEAGIRATGQAQTGKYTKSTAEIENAFIEGTMKGMDTVGTKMTSLFGDMVDQTAKYVHEKFDAMINGAKSGGDPVAKNETKSGKKK